MSSEEAKEAMRGDGFKSRKFIATISTIAVSWTTATVGWLVLERMSASEWIGFNQWTLPLCLAAYAGANVLEKFAVAKAASNS